MSRKAIALGCLLASGLYASSALAAPDDLVLVSRGFDGRAGGASMGTGSSEGAAISADGQRVVYFSNAPNMYSGETRYPQWQIYVRDMRGGLPVLVSRADGVDGAPSDNGGAINAPEVSMNGMSDDGRYVYFTGDIGGGGRYGYRRDVETSRTELVTSNPAELGGWTILGPGKGRYMLFVSRDAILPDVGAIPNRGIYLRDLETGTTVLVSRENGIHGAPIDDYYLGPTGVSPGGRFVAFRTVADGVVPGVDRPGYQVYLRDIRYGRTILVSRKDGPSGAPVERMWTGSTPVTPNGCRVVFDAKGYDIAPGSPANGGDQTYVRDICAGSTALVSRADGPAGPPAQTLRFDDSPSAETYTLDMSADGRYVLFETAASNLAAGLRPGVPQYYVRDLVAGRTILISRQPGPDGAPDRDNTGHYVSGSLSADVRYVAFNSVGTNLLPEANGAGQVYRRELGAMPPGDPMPTCGAIDDPGLGGTAPPACTNGEDEGKTPDSGTRVPAPRPVAVNVAPPAAPAPGTAGGLTQTPAGLYAPTPTLIRAPTLRSVSSSRTRVSAWVDLPATLQVQVSREVVRGKRRSWRAWKTVSRAAARAGTARVTLPKLGKARYRLTIRALGLAGARSSAVTRTLDLRPRKRSR